MTNQELQALKYPIGGLSFPKEISTAMMQEWIDNIASFPNQIKTAIEGLNEAELNWIYRPDGWTIKQVIHHCADSHMNAFIRFKLALTEEIPTIKPYLEASWAQLADTTEVEVDHSVRLLEALHYRWAVLLKSMTEEDFQRKFHHPELKRDLRLQSNLCLYSWHCQHHLAHVKQAKAHKGQFL